MSTRGQVRIAWPSWDRAAEFMVASAVECVSNEMKRLLRVRIEVALHPDI